MVSILTCMAFMLCNIGPPLEGILATLWPPPMTFMPVSEYLGTCCS